MGATAYVVLLISLFVTAWVPDIKGKLRTIHRLSAYAAVLAMPLVLANVLESVQMSLFTQIVVSVAIMVQAIMIYMLFYVPKAYRHFLVFQSLYLAAFFIALLSVTYG
jgi:hypothetical protein